MNIFNVVENENDYDLQFIYRPNKMKTQYGVSILIQKNASALEVISQFELMLTVIKSQIK